MEYYIINTLYRSNMELFVHNYFSATSYNYDDNDDDDDDDDDDDKISETSHNTTLNDTLIFNPFLAYVYQTRLVPDL